MDAVKASCFNFDTMGSYTWYGFLQNLPKEAIVGSANDANRNAKNRKHGVKIPTHLYRNEHDEEEFVR
jgi:hypothetical protein